MAVSRRRPLCAAVLMSAPARSLSFVWRVGLVVALFSLVAVMCLSWLYTCRGGGGGVVLAKTCTIKNVASVMGICLRCRAHWAGGVQQFSGSIPSEAWYTLFAIMGTLPIHRGRRCCGRWWSRSPETK